MYNGKTYYEELGYLWLLRDVINNGINIPDRTGVNTLAMFDAKWVIESGFPFSTVRPAPTRAAFEELWFFMRGQTQTKILEDKNINFWKGNTSRRFLDNRGLLGLNEGNMGEAYGFQWRGFGASSSITHGELVRHDDGVDQFIDIHTCLSNDRYSRRMYTTFWNPKSTPNMALTPCWHSHQFVVLPDDDGVDCLHLKVVNRSLDILFGMPFAVQQYRLYQMAVAKLYGFKVGVMTCDLTHIHIYNNQIDYVKETLTRDMGTKGEIYIKKDLKSVADLLSLEWEDIDIVGLQVNNEPYRTPRPPMAE